MSQRRVRPADVEAALRQIEIGNDRLHAVDVEIDDGRAFHSVGHRLERHPATGVARHGEAVQAIVEVFLHAGWCQHRHHHGLENVLGLVRQRGGAGAVVIAGDSQHTAELRGAGGVGVAEHVAAAVHAGAFAVPHAEHAVVLGAGEQVDLLGAP
ncbi:hypothetical protein D3C78_551920 [compost metagenome]